MNGEVRCLAGDALAVHGALRDLCYSVLKGLTLQNDDDLRRRSVKALSIVGSVARDEATDSSDVDLLVEFESPEGLLEFFRLQHHIEDLLDVDMPIIYCTIRLLPNIGCNCEHGWLKNDP